MKKEQPSEAKRLSLKMERYRKNRLFLKGKSKNEESGNFDFYVTPTEKCNLDLNNFSDLGFYKRDYD